MSMKTAGIHVGAVIMLMMGLASLMQGADDAARANGYDAAWATQWANHARTLLATAGKTAGFVLQVGDSITHSNPYCQWPRNGAGKNATDTATTTWCQAAAFPGTQNDTTSTNGWYLAIADTNINYRGMTASSGMDCAEFLSGAGNGGTTMPALTNLATARAALADGVTYSGNLNATTVASAFDPAQIAVLMLGTNDINGGRTPANTITDLSAIIDQFEAHSILVILSTIPPLTDATKNANAVTLNASIRSLAQTRNLPLIDFYAEILARQPGTAWQGTLISGDGIHPTSAWGSTITSSSDPYATGGNAATGLTGSNPANVGYLLRSWLTVQKLQQIKDLPPSSNAAPVVSVASATPSTVTGTSTALSATATDDAGEPALIYTWSASGPAGVTFSPNGTNAAKSSTATFSRIGSYTVTVTAKDVGNLTHSKNVTVTVNATFTSVTVTPLTATVSNGSTRSFSAIAKDQFSQALSVTPSFTWSLVGSGGSIDLAGLFTATSDTGTVTVNAQATSGVTRTGSATVTLQAAGATPGPTTVKHYGTPSNCGLGGLSGLGLLSMLSLLRRRRA